MLSLAWRNVLRNGRRSTMTLVAMVLGLTTVLLFGGYIRDINYALRSDFVRISGHLQIQHRDYFHLGSGNPAAYGIQDYESVLAAIRSDPVLSPMLAVATPVLQFGAIAGNSAAGVSRTAFVTGSVIEDQNRLRAWNEYGLRIVSGRPPLTKTASDTAVIGAGMARVLQLCDALSVPDCTASAAPQETGATDLPSDIAALSSIDSKRPLDSAAVGRSQIEILAASSRGAPNVATVTVLRAEFQGIKELDDVYLGLHLQQAQKLVYGAEPPQATAIVLQLEHTAQMPAARVRLEELLGSTFNGEPLRVIDYETLNPFYGQTIAMFATMFGFISVLIGAIVLFTVSNTMSMVIVERTAEIGTLRAVGMRRAGIRKIFVTEGTVLGCLGAALGTLMAIGVATLINQLELTWIPPGRVEPVALAVRVASEHLMMVGGALALILLAALSALIPAARAARMNIVDALRHV